MSMTEPEILFIKTLADIESRLSKSDPYEILLISGLLRKLFLDELPLVDQVNRNHRSKLFFEIGVQREYPDIDPYLTFSTIQDGLDPDTSPPFTNKLRVNRDQFFKTVVTVYKNHRFTIREIVLFESNVMGGIHAGSPKNEKEAVLKIIETTIAIGGYASSLRQLLAISRVILKSLEPLRQAIIKVN